MNKCSGQENAYSDSCCLSPLLLGVVNIVLHLFSLLVFGVNFVLCFLITSPFVLTLAICNRRYMGGGLVNSVWRWVGSRW